VGSFDCDASKHPPAALLGISRLLKGVKWGLSRLPLRPGALCWFPLETFPTIPDIGDKPCKED
jgi:hypothetical protein